MPIARMFALVIRTFCLKQRSVVNYALCLTQAPMPQAFLSHDSTERRRDLRVAYSCNSDCLFSSRPTVRLAASRSLTSIDSRGNLEKHQVSSAYLKTVNSPRVSLSNRRR